MANEKRLIDANAFGMYLADVQLANRGWKDDICDFLDDVMFVLDEQPTVDAVEVVHGRWVDVREKRIFGEHYSLCSNCKTRNGSMIPFNYCPNCGAKMDGDGNA